MRTTSPLSDLRALCWSKCEVGLGDARVYLLDLNDLRLCGPHPSLQFLVTAARVSIDPCVLVCGHETIFEGSQIEGALSRRLGQAQGRGRQDLLGVDAHHKALAQEA